MSSLPSSGVALVVGASGGIGSALVAALQAVGQFDAVIGLSRSSKPAVDLEREDTIADTARRLEQNGELRLVIDATGILQAAGIVPEKSWRWIDPAAMAKSFAVNAIGPALLMKHFLPLLPRDGKSVFASLSAKVGSIGDNRSGGWYSYRASKAALNQLVRTAAIELARTHPQAICVAIHPGTVDTGLSQPFAKTGLNVQTPEQAAKAILACLDGLKPRDSGGFFDRFGKPLPW